MGDKEINSYTSSFYLDFHLKELELSMLRAFKHYCEMHPEDKEADKRWLDYSNFFIQQWMGFEKRGN